MLYGQPEIAFRLDEQNPLDPQWLLTYFETETKAGRRFTADQTVQVGWMILMLKPAADGSGDLELWEPQFDALPVQWTNGVNNTLRHLILQRSVCDLFKCDPLFPSLQQAGVVSREFLKNDRDFWMSRDEPQRNDSGWVFSQPGHVIAEDDGKFMSLFEIVFYRQEIIPFLALSPGAQAAKVGGRLEAEFAGLKLSSDDDGFLRKLATSSVFV
jgi:hypothetical protein